MDTFVALVYVAFVFVVCTALWVFVRHCMVARRSVPGCARLTAMVVVESFQCENRARALEEIEFKKESWRQEVGDGDDVSRRRRGPAPR